jgi:4-hydroxybenzoate polyprenyltransferase
LNHLSIAEILTPVKKWLKALRVHQWLKNLLIFIPMLAAHNEKVADQWRRGIIAFAAFCLGASAIYLINDLADKNEDKNHPTKKYRPISAGQINNKVATVVASLFIIASILVASTVNRNTGLTLTFYLILTYFYSYYLKKIAIVDVIVLTMFYVIRVIAGANATQTLLSFWLLALSIFIFLSLGFAKRYSELATAQSAGIEVASKRGYRKSDAPIVLTLGIAAGYAGLVIFALYLNTDLAQSLYAHPQYIWALVPVLGFWVNWIWLQAYRGEMNEDPVQYAATQKASLFTALIGVVVLVASSIR